MTRDGNHLVFAGIAQGFRAPNLSDLTRLDTARSDEIETPSPGLDPENYTSCEMGLKSRFARFTAQASCYHTVIDGMIVRTPTGRTIDGDTEVTKKNAGSGFVQGVELTARYAVTPAWSVWCAGSAMNGRIDGYPTSDAKPQRDYVSRLMPPTAELGVRWRSETGKYWCELLGRAAAKADKLSDDDKRDTQRIPPGGTPGYVVCHIRTGANLTRLLSIGLEAENVFDEDYRIHGSGVNEAGRNLILVATCAL
jgi:hemoglobin/transferrin/lactoferrin receptor protein